MSRKKIVAGNWKMNTSYNEAVSLVKDILSGSDNQEITKIIFPPFPFLRTVSDELSKKENFYCGAQNCSEHEKGAFTGETSASMIRSVGCKYVLTGHSERRTYFNETDHQLAAKLDQALKNDLIPVFCFGEQLAERKAGRESETVKGQLTEVLRHFDEEKLNDLILAYEPVWAIGTGETATPGQVQAMHAFVRNCITELFSSELAERIPLLYGGSCNAQNAAELFACADVDGGLIGGASLKANDFCKIISSF